MRRALVALRKESVDRNGCFAVDPARRSQSLSARRAWIEMHKVGEFQGVHYVALRKESGDRNCVGFCLGAKADRSLSARRAWIEISEL